MITLNRWVLHQVELTEQLDPAFSFDTFRGFLTTQLFPIKKRITTSSVFSKNGYKKKKTKRILFIINHVIIITYNNISKLHNLVL